MPGTLMVQGTSSDAGKSVLAAGICRLLQRRGIRVAPFKPQNMSLNAAVTVDGGEIGRAQALQAQAAGIAAHSDMNPVLLKPSSDTGAQVIIQGRVARDMEAADYHHYKTTALAAVMESYRRLCSDYEAVIVEGAGSPAEVNLRDRDIANMGFAETADCPVILVADIDRGGVFAHLVGTLELLSPSEQARVRGFVINRFRGDIALLQPGLDWLEQRTGKPVLGVLPYLHNLQLDAEDAIAAPATGPGETVLRVAVPALSRISNHTDFEVLAATPGVALDYVGPGRAIPGCDLVILPGSKNTRADLAFLRKQGWDRDIQRHLRYGGKLLGICGGYQMLGREIADPLGIEGKPGSSPALGYLPLATRLTADKTLRQVDGSLYPDGTPVSGYEIHCGDTDTLESIAPFAVLADGRRDGAVSADGQVAGTYLHGLFDQPAAAAALLHWAGFRGAATIDRHALREAELERLADCLEQHLDLVTALPGLQDLPNWSTA